VSSFGRLAIAWLGAIIVLIFLINNEEYDGGNELENGAFVYKS